MMSFARPIALVTGASSGFGLLTSVALAQKEYQVVASMRGMSRSERLLQLAEQAGVKNAVVTISLDVTIQESLGRDVKMGL